MQSRTYEQLLKIRQSHGCGFLVLLDPDRSPVKDLARFAALCDKSGADAFLFGSSIMVANDFEKSLLAVKKAVKKPVIIFPGSSTMISSRADALLFLSMISGRNPNLLIGEHVKAAPAIKKLGIEVIPTAYMLIESGVITSVAYLSNTFPIPNHKSDIACAHALAGQYLGMKLVYLEAGSGAEKPVPVEMVKKVSSYVEIPVIVGGGIRQAEHASQVARAGASFVVIGNALEDSPRMVKEFAEAIHTK
ncbi:MAG: geranylgeranylglyceryl/heptaprenylglyceryl phosphate synthase [candidate division Zixibacteria bacterium]|jgi:putative glycerol-1-phosphate prenyltransferase|nr:geranylgeranylglyceryl/heptaprenylglyceryl phosphate synthase [candidate division Zixibacteria bacterium]